MPRGITRDWEGTRVPVRPSAAKVVPSSPGGKPAGIGMNDGARGLLQAGASVYIKLAQARGGRGRGPQSALERGTAPRDLGARRPVPRGGVPAAGRRRSAVSKRASTFPGQQTPAPTGAPPWRSSPPARLGPRFVDLNSQDAVLPDPGVSLPLLEGGRQPPTDPARVNQTSAASDGLARAVRVPDLSYSASKAGLPPAQPGCWPAKLSGHAATSPFNRRSPPARSSPR